jgi:signal peptidase I
VQVKKRLLALLIIGAISTIGATWTINNVRIVHGDSMFPTYHNLEPVRFKPIDRPLRVGDVVIFHHDGETCIKRVAFLSGQSFLKSTIQRKNYTAISYHWNDDIGFSRNKNAHVEKVTIPQDCVFVLGDNDVMSVDSRTYGPIPINSIYGIVSDGKGPVCIG